MSEIKINLASGSDYREGWINVDITDVDNYNHAKQKVDVFANVKDKLPFEDNYADCILAREVFEHTNRHDALELLKEIYRVLEPGGGLVELTVPPAERQLKLLLAFMGRETNINEFNNAHNMQFNVWKAIDDLCGATVRTIVDGKDIGDYMSHKCFYSKSMLRMLFEHVGFKILSIDDSIKVFAIKE